MLDFIHRANGPDWGLRVAAMNSSKELC
jgi:hypothetical protein